MTPKLWIIMRKKNNEMCLFETQILGYVIVAFHKLKMSMAWVLIYLLNV